MNKYSIIGIIIVTFIIGIGLSYTIFSETIDPFSLKFKNQEGFNKMIAQNPMMNKAWLDTQQIEEFTPGNMDGMSKGMMKKQQNRNQIGLMIHDPELGQQMKNLNLQNTNNESPTNEIIAYGKSADSSVSVKIKTSSPTPGKFLDIIETFHDKNGDILEHVNHSIHVSQDEQTVLKMSDLHSHYGEVTYFTRELHSSSPVKVEILLNGIGMDEPLTGPIDETIIVEIAS